MVVARNRIVSSIILVLALFLCAASAFADLGFTAPAALNDNAASDTGADFAPKLATDGAGNWVAVWHSNDSLGGTIGADMDILCSRSPDNGRTWTSPEPLNTNAAADGAALDTSPCIATDDAGDWLAIWRRAASVSAEGDIYAARSTDNGASWTAPTPVNTGATTDTANDFEPSLTISTGVWLAVWRIQEPAAGLPASEGDLRVARSLDYGANWGAALRLNTDANTDTSVESAPQICAGGGGNWLAVWSATDPQGNDGDYGTDADVFFTRSTNNGQSWTAPDSVKTTATTDTADDIRPCIASDLANTWIVAWSSNDTLGDTLGADYDILYSTSVSNGFSWAAAAALNTNARVDTLDDSAPCLAFGYLRIWTAVWQITQGGDTDVVVAHTRTNGAKWFSRATFNLHASSDLNTEDDPFILCGENAHWVAAWHSTDSLGGAIGTDGDIFFSTSHRLGFDAAEPEWRLYR